MNRKHAFRLVLLLLGMIVIAGLMTASAQDAAVHEGAVAGEQRVTADILAKTGRCWNGSPLPDYPKGTPEITILRFTIPPGVQLPLHHHPVINAGVLLDGELTVVTDDNRTLHLKAGDSMIEVVNTWHYGKNEGTRNADLIVFYAGVKETPITVPKVELPPTGGSPR